MDDDAILEGPIEDGTILHILHSLTSQDYFDGLLELTSSGALAKIWLQKGQVLAAVGFGLFDEEAVQAILLCRSGSYAFRKTAALPPARIEKNTVDLLIECLAKVDEKHGTNMREEYQEIIKKSQNKFYVGAGATDAEEKTNGPLVTEESHPGFEEVSAESVAAEASMDEEDEARPAEAAGNINVYQKKDRAKTAKSSAEPAGWKKPRIVAARDSHRGRRLVPVLVTVAVVEAVVLIYSLSPMRQRQMEEKLAAAAAEEFVKQDTHQRRINEIIQRGDTLRDAGELKKSLACYKDAKTLAPDDRRLDTILAQTREAIKRRIATASATRQTADRAEQEKRRTERVNALIEAGDQDERRGDLDGALSKYREAEARDPGNPGISSLIANVGARIMDLQEDAARARADQKQAEEAVRRVKDLINAGSAKRQAGALEGALADYLDALILSPRNEVVRREMLAVRKEIEGRGAPEAGRNTWVVNVRVRSTTVHTMALDEGRVVDIQMSARGGVVKLGQINPFGKAAAVYYKNPHPRSLGEALFELNGSAYKIRWQLMDIEVGLHEYRLTVKKGSSAAN